MKILQVSEARDGDIARHVADLAWGLTIRGHQVHIFQPPATTVAAGYPYRTDFPTAAVNSTDTAPDDSGSWGGADRQGRPFGALLRHLRRHGPFDLIHAHGASAGLLVRLAALLSTAGVIYSPHASIALDRGSLADDRAMRGPHRLVEQFLSRFTSRVVCSSVAEYEHLAHILRIAEHRLVLLHAGLRPDAFRTEADLRALLGLPRDAKIIGFIGRALPHRGADTAMQALRLLRQTRSDVHLVMLGSGPEAMALRDLATSLDVAASVHWLGDHLPHDHYHNLTVLVCPSRHLDAAYAPLDALYCGVPVVATSHGAPRELFTSGLTGFFVPPDDPAALARELAVILGNDRMRSAMAPTVNELRVYLELDRMLDEIEEIYFGRLSSRRPVPAASDDGAERGAMMNNAMT
jgi:glycosyltransferase involved in cell wall biosynthesis